MGSLSDNIVEGYYNEDVLKAKDVKEFIKRVEIRMLKRFKMAAGTSVMKIIKEEAGKDLI